MGDVWEITILVSKLKQKRRIMRKIIIVVAFMYSSLENCRKRHMQKCWKRQSYFACKYLQDKNMAGYTRDSGMLLESIRDKKF